MSDSIHEIQRSDNLLRRIPLKPSHIFQGRITSACFKTKPGEDGLSVDIEKWVEDIYKIFSQETHTLARLGAAIPMELGYECRHAPIEGNFSHALIVGDTNPIAKKLSLSCVPIESAILSKV